MVSRRWVTAHRRTCSPSDHCLGSRTSLTASPVQSSRASSIPPIRARRCCLVILPRRLMGPVRLRTTPPEHLQMGMVGQLYVRPRQNRVPIGGSLYNALVAQQTDPRTACNSAADILCSNPVPAVVPVSNGRAATGNYAYNDGDGSTHYDVEYPIQIHGFDH